MTALVQGIVSREADRSWQTDVVDGPYFSGADMRYFECTYASAQSYLHYRGQCFVFTQQGVSLYAVSNAHTDFASSMNELLDLADDVCSRQFPSQTEMHGKALGARHCRHMWHWRTYSICDDGILIIICEMRMRL
jgi:hypothetical protein